MRNKKEKIINEKIKCYIQKDSDIVKIETGEEKLNIELKIKYIEEFDEFDKLTNYLFKIQKALAELKLKFDFSEKTEVLIIVDVKDILKIIKPEGKILQKPSKSLKKSIDNINFKRTLGILLYEFSTFNNIDLTSENFLLEKKEDDNMNNNFKIEEENFDFNIEEQNESFDLDMDFSSFEDIITPETDSFNCEDDLFKDFDLDASDLFKENAENSDFILDFSSDEIENNLKINSSETTEDNLNIFSEKTNIENGNDFNICLETEDSKESTKNILEDNSSILNDEILIDDNFTIEDDFIDIKDENDNIPVYESKNNIETPVYEPKEDIEIPTYESKEDIEVPVYESKEDDFLIISNSKNEVSNNIEEVPNDVKEGDFSEVDNKEKEISCEEKIENKKNTEQISSSITETKNKKNKNLVKKDFVNTQEKHNSNVNPKKENPKNNHGSKNDSKTSIIKKDNIESNSIKKDTQDKGGVKMENNNIGNVNNNSNNKEFVKKEMIDLRNILKNKSNSYKSKVSKLNVEFEEKHNALKDFNLRDEDEQYKIFKEFLKCKSNLVDLKDLSETCNSIIVDIESKISNL